MKRILKIIAYFLLGLIIFLSVLILLVRTPWAQQKITDYAIGYLTGKTNTEVDIKKLFITFGGNVQLEGLFMADTQGDTLVYLGSLNTGVSTQSLFKGNLVISHVEIEALTAHVHNENADSTFNYQFIIDAFEREDQPVTRAEEKEPGSLPSLFIGKIDLSNIKLRYADIVEGIESSGYIGQLQVKPYKIDLENMVFHITSIAIENTSLGYTQLFKAVSEDSPNDPTQKPQPSFRIDQLSINETQFRYQDISDSLLAENRIASLELENTAVDLENQQISLNAFALRNSGFHWQLPQVASEPEIDQIPVGAASPFEWPDWEVTIGSIDIVENSLAMDQGASKPLAGQFDVQHIELQQINFRLDDIQYKPAHAAASINHFNFEERSGLKIEQLSMELALNDQSFEIRSMHLQSPHNKWKADVRLNYTAFDDLLADFLNNVNMEIELDMPMISLRDAVFFDNYLNLDSSLSVIEKLKPRLSTQLQGNLKDLDLMDFTLGLGRHTELSLKGTVHELADTARLNFNLPQLHLTTHWYDLLAFDLDSLHGHLPQQYQIDASARGTLHDIKSSLLLELDQSAQIELLAEYQNIRGLVHYDLALDASQLPLSKWAGDSSLSDADISLRLNGSGTDLDQLKVKTTLDVSQLSYKQYDLKPLRFKADFDQKKLVSQIIFEDDHIDLTTDINAVLDSSNFRMDVNLDLQKADLMAIGYSEEPLDMRMNLVANAAGTTREMTIHLDIMEGTIVDNGLAYPVDDFTIDAFLASDSTALDWKSAPIRARLQANASTENIMKAIQRQLTSYFEGSEVTDSTAPVKVLLELDILESPLVTRVLLPDLKEFKPLKVTMEFDESRENLQANVSLPLLKYAGIEIDSLHLALISTGMQFDFQSFIRKIDVGSVSMNETRLTAVYEEEEIKVAFNMLDIERSPLFNMNAALWSSNDTTYIHLEDEGFLLNSEPWQVNPKNLVCWSDDHIRFSDFTITQKEELLQISSPKSTREDLNIQIKFEAFQLANFINLINPENEWAEGLLQGEFNLLKIDGNFAVAGLVQVDELHLLGHEAGHLEVAVKNLKENQYDFSLSLKGGVSDLDINGFYLATAQDPEIFLDLVVNKLSLDLLASFSAGFIKESEGNLSGKLHIEGPLLSPVHDGFIQFDQAELLVAATNSSFRLPEERINIEADLISLKNFTIVDAKGNKLNLNGQIGTKVLLNPTFDFGLKTNNFQLLNSAATDNELFYGKAFVDADIKVNGTLLRPDITAKVALRRGTDLVFVIPESQIDLISREGTVEFVNFETDSSFTSQTQQDSLIRQAQVSGLSLQSVVQVDKATSFKVIIDQRSGDYLSVGGHGDLSLDVKRNGMVSLFGIYEIDQGSYQLSMYELVKRKFEIAPGSTIQWVGDPYNAKMQLTANYQVDASPADLMANQISGADQSVQNRYKNQLPFIVKLNINGELLQPELSFGLDMPDDEKGALDGSVYGKIQGLNRDENELNKQVFALLVLNRFFPSGSIGGTSTSQMARSSASQLLTSQLNNLSGRYIKGVDINMDLTSFTDYQSGSSVDRTRLNVNVSKSLFNERFRVTVGSGLDLEGSQRTQQSATDIIGNITLEYLLDEEGVYRVKGFRKNEFVGMLDGQLVVSGIALLFNKEINRLKELWEEE